MSDTSRNHLLLRAARRERTERTPVWLMRQAGRFDPEYRALRERHTAPLEVLFRTPQLAAEISLLPRRFNVDAIIFYQDILTPLAPMGADFVFRPGPVLDDPPRDSAALGRLRAYTPSDETLPFVGETLSLVKRELNGALPLLGFAGAPFTLAAFMVEGASPPRDLPRTRALMQADPSALHQLLQRLARVTATYLRYQAARGADAVQLFESLADLLSQDEYTAWAQPYQQQVFAEYNQTTPTILYAKEWPNVAALVATGASVISLGASVDLADAKARYGDRVAFQGNISNQLVARGPLDAIETAVRTCVAAGGHEGHILNLSHGVLPDTPFEHGVRVIEICRQIRLTTEGQ